MTFRRGGNLSIEDGKGCIRTMFLEDGFLDFLNKVFGEYYFDNCVLFMLKHKHLHETWAYKNLIHI